MWSVCASQQVTETLGNALKKMAFPLLYLEPPLQDQSNVPPPGEKGLGYCCQVTVSMQTGYVSRIHRMMTSCWGGRDKRLFTRFISSLFVERVNNAQTTCTNNEMNQPPERVRKNSDVRYRREEKMLVPEKQSPEKLDYSLTSSFWLWEQLRPVLCRQ